jgi:hypothetical protein
MFENRLKMTLREGWDSILGVTARDFITAKTQSRKETLSASSASSRLCGEILVLRKETQKETFLSLS